ncbi:MAG: hypothetical protein WC223_02140 [Bacteroidales bacterium]
MKKIIVIVILTGIFISNTFAQKAITVPQEVSTSFAKKIPNIKPSWTAADTNYVASFKFEGSDTKATFANNGTWLETATPISSKELPGATSDFIKKTFFKDPSNVLFKVKEIYLKETPSGMIYYVTVREVAIEGLIEMTFKTNGAVISSTDQQGASFDIGGYIPKNKIVIKKVVPDEPEEETTSNTKKTENLSFKPKSVAPASLPYPITFYLDTTITAGNYTIKEAFLMRNTNGENVFFVNIIKKGETAVQNDYFNPKGYHIENPDSVPKAKDSIIYSFSPKTVAEANARELKKAELLKQKQKEEKEKADKEKAEAEKIQKAEKEKADKEKAEEEKKQKELKAEELKRQKEEKAQAEKEKAEEAKKQKEQKAEELKRQKEEKEKAEKERYKTVDNSSPEEILKSVKETEVPPKVIANLKKKFKNPEFIKWFTLSNDYVGMFKMPKSTENDTTKAEYTPDGVWVKTHTEMDPNSMPDLVYSYIDANLKKQKIIRARHVVNAKRDDYYQVKLSKKEDQYTTVINEVLLDKMGKPYKKKEDAKKPTTPKTNSGGTQKTTPAGTQPKKPVTTKPATKKPVTINQKNLPVDTILGITYDTVSAPIQTPIDTISKPKTTPKSTKPKTAPKKTTP